MKSILDEGRRCYLCGSTRDLEKHHIYGAALRHKSEQYGLTVTLCHSCHNEPPNGVHYSAEAAARLKAEAQRKAMQTYGWTQKDFVNRFYKNYLD